MQDWITLDPRYGDVLAHAKSCLSAFESAIEHFGRVDAVCRRVAETAGWGVPETTAAITSVIEDPATLPAGFPSHLAPEVIQTVPVDGSKGRAALDHALDLMGAIADEQVRLPDLFFSPIHLLNTVRRNPHRTSSSPAEVRSALSRIIGLCESLQTGADPGPYDAAKELPSVCIAAEVTSRARTEQGLIVNAAGLRVALESLSSPSAAAEPSADQREEISALTAEVLPDAANLLPQIDLEPLRTYVGTWDKDSLLPALVVATDVWTQAGDKFLIGDGKPKTGSAGAPPSAPQATSPHWRHHQDADLRLAAQSFATMVQFFGQAIESQASFVHELNKLFPLWQSDSELEAMKIAATEARKSPGYHQRRDAARQLDLHRRVTQTRDEAKAQGDLADRYANQLTDKLKLIESALDERDDWFIQPDIFRNALEAIEARTWRPSPDDIRRLSEEAHRVASAATRHIQDDATTRERQAAEDFAAYVSAELARQGVSQFATDDAKATSPILYHACQACAAVQLYVGKQELAETLNDKRIPDDVTAERAAFLSTILGFDKANVCGISPERATLDRDVAVKAILAHLPPLIDTFNDPEKSDYDIAKLFLRFCQRPNRSDASRVAEEIHLFVRREISRTQNTSEGGADLGGDGDTGNATTKVSLYRSGDESDGEWTREMSAKTIAEAIGIDRRSLKAILGPTGLIQRSRERWIVRWDNLPNNDMVKALRAAETKEKNGNGKAH